MRRNGLILTLLPMACSTITDAESFKIGDRTVSDRLCDRCPDSPSLRLAPCPPTAGDTSELVSFFALRRLDFGCDDATWVEGYDAGMDQDCSTRPEGRTVTCAPRTNETMVSLPSGVDNALAQAVLHPLVSESGLKFTNGLNEAIAHGQGGMLLILDGWNRTGDDPQVGARLVATRGTEDGAEPRWDGTDSWQAYATKWDDQLPQVPSTSYNVSSTAYVRDGTLVWDMRGEEKLQLYVQSKSAVVRLDLRDGVLMGRIVTGSAKMQIADGSFAGVWNLFDAQRQANALAQVMAGCDESERCPMEASLRQRMAVAPDLHLPGSNKGLTEACDAISVGISAEFEETGGVADFLQPDELPASCEGDAIACPNTDTE